MQHIRFRSMVVLSLACWTVPGCSGDDSSTPGDDATAVTGGTSSTGGTIATSGGTSVIGWTSATQRMGTGSGGDSAIGGAGSSGGRAAATGGVATGGKVAATGGAGTGGKAAATGGAGTGGKAAATGGAGAGGAAAGGAGSTAACSDASLVWKSANKTNYTSYPDPGSEECIKYNGCTWAGQFAACDDKKTEEWVAAHNIVSAFPDFDALQLHDLCLRKGQKLIVVTVLDTCADSDCSGCCTQNKGSADQLIDIESYTDARWGVPDGPIEWADLGPTKGSGCN